MVKRYYKKYRVDYIKERSLIFSRTGLEGDDDKSMDIWPDYYIDQERGTFGVYPKSDARHNIDYKYGLNVGKSYYRGVDGLSDDANNTWAVFRVFEFDWVGSGAYGSNFSPILAEVILTDRDRYEFTAKAYKLVNKAVRGSYIGQVIEEGSKYPIDGVSGGYWYVRGEIANQAPTISGSNLDLGSKLENFDVDYIVNDPDAGDNLMVDILVDGVKKVSAKSVTAGIKNSYSVDLSEFTLGEHTVQIIASDGQTESEPRVYTFYKSNSAPAISGVDGDIGGKSTPFTETFTVEDRNNDQVSVIITLNGLEIKSISNAEGQSQSFTITQELLSTLEVGSTNTIVIRADDGKGGVSYRRITFTRENRPPIISGTNRDLGNKTETFGFEYQVTDLEGDAISSKVYLNNILMEEIEEVSDGGNNIFNIPHNTFIELPPGKHTIKVEAMDSQGGMSQRVVTFTKVIEDIEFYIQIQKTDVRVEKILAIFNKFIADGDTMTLKASNNFSDENPTWEDITEESEKKLAYLFENTTKTADTWDLGLWCKVVKGNSGVESVFRGVSGGFE